MSQIAGKDYGFRKKIPAHVTNKIADLSPDHPVSLQFLPHPDEANLTGEIDPLQEQSISQYGIIQKYKHRILIVTSGACAIHCRYCFRRHFPYSTHSILKHLDALDIHLKANPDIYEVILSGGDPLSLKNHQLQLILDIIKKHQQIKTIRIHSRIPTVQPDRIDDELLTMIHSNQQWHWVLVTHINHADELDPHNGKKLSSLKKAGVILLNQAVLLKGVNDELSQLKTLSFKLFDHNILPYYLHQLDPVQGAMHFHVDIQQGQALVKALHAELPGYLVPKYVCEQPNQPSKTPL